MFVADIDTVTLFPEAAKASDNVFFGESADSVDAMTVPPADYLIFILAVYPDDKSMTASLESL